MNSSSTITKAMRWVLTISGLIGGFFSVFYGLIPLQTIFQFSLADYQKVILMLLGTLVGGVAGLLLAPWLLSVVWQFTTWVEAKLNKMPTADILSGVIGLILGLVIANLIGSAFSRIPAVGPILPIFGSIVLGYLGFSFGLKRKEDLAGFFNLGHFVGRLKERGDRPDTKTQYKILDTSVIIDGRIADLCKTGFIEGTLVIPNFVLEELRHIADSSDILKRNRGRRGLDILNKMQKDDDIKVLIYEKDPTGAGEVDSKLVRLAKIMRGKVITNDYNLNKVAELQGIEVLNINELANAVKPVVLPGEEMVVTVVKDGKESGQGIAYLDDGTMIVVDGGKKHVGDTIGVMVTSILQTAAGRMIFAKPKSAEKVIS